MSDAIIAYGATVERSIDGTTWEPIPEVVGVAVPAVVRNWVDVTHLQSPGGFREYKPGLKDAGEIAIPCNYTSAGYAQQIADQTASETGGPIHYRTTLPPNADQADGDVFLFDGYPVPSLDGGDDPEAKIGMTITIRTTGAFEFTAGVAAA